jgi:hypothetical protein
LLKDCRYDAKTKVLSIDLKSFTGHSDEIIIVSPTEISKLFIDDNPYVDQLNIETKDGVKIIKFGFTHNSYSTALKLEFK